MQPPVTGYGVLDDHHIHNAELESRRLAEEIEREAMAEANAPHFIEAEEPAAVHLPVPLTGLEIEERRLTAAAREVTQAVSVAAAYFEDTLEMAPGLVLAAGTMGAEVLGGLLREAGFVENEMRVREMVDPAMLVGGATSTRVPHGWMAGVRGALRS